MSKLYSVYKKLKETNKTTVYILKVEFFILLFTNHLKYSINTLSI